MAYYAMIQRVLFWCVLLSLVVVPASASLWEKGPEQQVELSNQRTLTDQEQSEIRSALKAGLLPFEAELPYAPYILDGYARDNVERLTRILHSRGYLDGKAVADIRYEEGEPSISYMARVGAVYRLAEISVELAKDNPAQRIVLPSISSIALEPGDILKAAQALNVQSTVKQWVEAENCIKAALVEYTLTLDRKQKTAHLVYTVHTGPRVRFGTMAIEGLAQVDAEYLPFQSSWKKGECFHQEKVTNLQKDLMQTGLLQSVNYTLVEKENQQIDVVFEVKERKHRTLKAGFRYNTDEGPGVHAEWQHRNYFGKGQNVTFGSDLSALFKTLYGRYDQSNFRRKDQSLAIHSEFREENVDAFNALVFDNHAMITRQLHAKWQVGGGVQYTLSEVEEDGADETYGLFGVPLLTSYDRRDDPLNATDGSYFRAQATPFTDTLNNGVAFLKSRVDASVFYAVPKPVFSEKDWLILALRGAIGSMLGASLGDVPATERFYAGGGGSVRGYGFQKAGPMTNGIPDGGQSLLEFSAEMRVKFNETVGGVLFVDGGNAYEEATPGSDVLWAAGIGVRYFTDFAPLRLDVGVPLNRRSGLDDAFQLYISIGQAF